MNTENKEHEVAEILAAAGVTYRAVHLGKRTKGDGPQP